MSDYTFDEDGNPTLRTNGASQRNFFSDEEDITNIFDVGGDGFDVTLSMAEETLSWTSVNPHRARKSKGKGLSLFRSAKHVPPEKDSLELKNILGVKIKRRKKNRKEGDGMCLGFIVYTYQQFGPNTYREKVIEFEHPSENLCRKYSERIFNYIRELPGRPQSVKLFMQVMAGHKMSKQLYRDKVLPIIQAAGIDVDCVEIQHAEFVKQEMVHINLDDYDCIACMGGDGTVNQVATGLMNKIQAKNDVEVKAGFTPVACNVPLCILPTGTTNQVAGSVLGIGQAVTSTIHMILGNYRQVDICSVYHEEKLLKWSFISQYGFGGNVLSMYERYKHKLGAKGLDAAILKALTKSKLRPYECEVEYIPADPVSNAEEKNTDNEYSTCRTGCTRCWTEELDDSASVTNDTQVQDFDPLNTSNNSESFMDLSKLESPWKTFKGSFLNVGLYSIPGNCEMAPEGLDKFSHLCDGSMDLVLVKDTSRKDFVRFIRRHANSKNQFEMPFVEKICVKEVRFKPRSRSTWNYKDHTYSEIEYRESAIKNRRGTIQSMDILEIEDERTTPKHRHTQSLQMLDNISDIDTDEDEGIDDIDDLSSDPASRKGSGGTNRNSAGSSRGSAGSRKKIKNGDVIINTAQQEKQLVGPQYRMTFAEKDKLKRKTRQIKKEEKVKEKEASKSRSVWNIDNEICTEQDLNFRVHHGLIKICGQGISPNTHVFTDSPVLCLSMMG
ncbi:ceramide kinase-like protein [Mizuhopecten yessoensis]|uniref:Ceramide kinase-like protein n=1 Tax=Mizuhopecten yessoensis TaxID=6573 RepID=A0A210Q9K4_MIZYE|nr:ceramide kinase-like protein [Mizuhopecten yessoensis]OWF45408.1 Ceramide kinase-like protein [Mizuhopecten yessoensis]